MPEREVTAITGPITSSLVLAAEDPAALARFYGALLNVEPQQGLSGTHWRVPCPAPAAAAGSSGPLPATKGGCNRRSCRAPRLDPPRQEPFGAEAWLLDPEGNRLLLLVLP